MVATIRNKITSKLINNNDGKNNDMLVKQKNIHDYLIAYYIIIVRDTGIIGIISGNWNNYILFQ